MKKSILSIFFFAIFFQLNAENKIIDSLLQVLPNLNQAESISCLNHLSQSYTIEDDLGKANEYAQKAFDLAMTSNDQLGLADSYDNFGMIFQSKFDYENAMKSFVDGLKIRNKLEDKKGIASSKNNIGRIFHLQEDEKSALINLKEALALRLSLKDHLGAAVTHANLGDVYLFKKTYGKAKDHYDQSFSLHLEVNDLIKAADIANFLGKITTDLGDYESAYAYFNTSLGLNSSLNDLPRISADFNNITKNYIAQKYFDEALESNITSANIREKLNDKFGMAECNKNFGLIYAGMNKRKEAEVYLSKSVDLLKEIGAEPGAQFIYQEISTAYKQLGNYKKAYKNHVAYSSSRNVLFNNEKSTALLKLTTKYESEFAAEKQKQQIAQLEAEKTFGQKLRYFLSALVVLGTLFLLVLLYSYRQKQKDNELLRNKNEEIQRQKSEIDEKNMELNGKNASLDVLNQKLVQEMAERESIEQSSFARDRFLATMSHEMRTPMNIITGLTHLLLEDDPRDNQVDHLRTLQFSANNLIVFINDVLDFSKIEAGKLNLDKREFNTFNTFEETHKRFKLPAKDKGLRLIYQYDNKLPDKLLGDPARLNQILTNLIGNAIEYTEEGTIQVKVKLHELKKQEATLLLTISDNGKGIDKTELETMFRKFSGKTGDIFEGYSTSGLGLAITKRLVDLQNGKIEVNSIKGQGTTFTVYLPYQLVTERTGEVKQIKPKETNLEHLAGNRVLLVEDNQINQLVVAKLLRKLGMEVITANNGLEALDAFEQMYFDLVLMDIQMPKMDGYRATAEIRKNVDTRKNSVPIIALTASAFLTEKEKAKLFGMNDHVGKPFGPNDLLEKISNCLTIHKMSTKEI